MKKVYLDHASTTHIGAEVLQSMMPYLTTHFGNASSSHGFGREAEKAVATARAKIARAINAEPSEIFFTSGATEANNWVMNGLLRGSESKRALVSRIEHPSIMDTVKHLEGEGYKIEYIDVDKDGIIVVSDLLSKLGRPAALVSVLTANNEIGTVQYINTIANLCYERGVLFHTDATQAIGSVGIDVKGMKIDALTLSAHKIYGPKGIGALYIRNGVKMDKFMHGGQGERNRRGGTQNVPAIVGFGTAVDIAMRDSSVNNGRIKSLRDYMISQIMARIEFASLNGHRTQRLANNVNFSFSGVDGESVMAMLDMDGIAVSTGSACTSGTLEPSHVLMAIGVMPNLVKSSVRFTLGRSTTKDDIDYTVTKLESIIKRLRSLSHIRVS